MKTLSYVFYIFATFNLQHLHTLLFAFWFQLFVFLDRVVLFQSCFFLFQIRRQGFILLFIHILTTFKA